MSNQHTKDTPPAVNPPAATTKEAPLPIELLKKQLADQDNLIAELEDEIGELQKHQKKVEDFLSRFGEYFNIEGKFAGLFIIHEFLNAGAYGVAVSPMQGLIGDLMLKPSLEPLKGEAYFKPLHVPNITKAAEKTVGATP